MQEKEARLVVLTQFHLKGSLPLVEYILCISPVYEKSLSPQSLRGGCFYLHFTS